MVARTFARPKTFALSLVALSAMVLFACGSDAASEPTPTPLSPVPTPTPTPTVPVSTPTPVIDLHPAIGQSLWLGVGDLAILNGDGARISLNGILSDNRCPLNVQCITGGAAVVEMTVRLSPSSPDEKWTLGIGPDKTAPSVRTLAGLQIELLEVEPVPGSGSSDDTVRVQLVVTTSLTSPT